MTVKNRTWQTLYEPKYGKPVNITMWNNKDFESTGRDLTVPSRFMKSWNAVLNFLTMRLQPRQGAVRKIYHLETKKLVRCLDEIKSNEKYIAVGAEKVKFIKNGYLTEEEKKVRGLAIKAPSQWHQGQGRHLDNVKSLENFMEMTQKNKRTVMYVMVSGRTCQTPLKVVLIERDLEDPKVLLDYLAYRLDVGEGIKYLCNKQGKIIKKPYKLKHGEVYIAVPFNGKFIKQDYSKLFKEQYPQRPSLEPPDVSYGCKRRKKKAPVDTASSPELIETFVGPEDVGKSEDRVADFTTFSEITLEKKPLPSTTPSCCAQMMALNKRVSFHESHPVSLFFICILFIKVENSIDEFQQVDSFVTTSEVEGFQQDDSFETTLETAASDSSSEITIYKIETSSMEIFITNEFLMNNETKPRVSLESGTVVEFFPLPENKSEIKLLKTFSMPIHLERKLYFRENKNDETSIEDYQQWVEKLYNIDVDCNETETKLDLTSKISQTTIQALSIVNLPSLALESSKKAQQIPVNILMTQTLEGFINRIFLDFQEKNENHFVEYHNQVLGSIEDLVPIPIQDPNRYSILKNKDEVFNGPITSPKDTSSRIDKKFFRHRDSIHVSRFSREISLISASVICQQLIDEMLDEVSRNVFEDDAESEDELINDMTDVDSSDQEKTCKCVIAEETPPDSITEGLVDQGSRCSYITADSVDNTFSRFKNFFASGNTSEEDLINDLNMRKVSCIRSEEATCPVDEANEQIIKGQCSCVQIDATTVGIQKHWKSKDELDEKSVQADTDEVVLNYHDPTTKDISDIYENFDRTSYLSTDTAISQMDIECKTNKCHKAECILGCSLICLKECPDDNIYPEPTLEINSIPTSISASFLGDDLDPFDYPIQSEAEESAGRIGRSSKNAENTYSDVTAKQVSFLSVVSNAPTIILERKSSFTDLIGFDEESDKGVQKSWEGQYHDPPPSPSYNQRLERINGVRSEEFLELKQPVAVYGYSQSEKISSSDIERQFSVDSLELGRNSSYMDLTKIDEGLCIEDSWEANVDLAKISASEISLASIGYHPFS
ncbi:unnamed protein product [Ceutorhynchus assimilis]|uniref:Doublecortin domain-containing protein n=1 Tax=Ceutorhynchus assimilis TaxID=467358 RepID=A0A9N9MPP7_9CUCU|nr:unnamed protein product [Ceutorhynchus assimilis]